MVEYLTYYSDGLPKEGWIQTCIMCETPCTTTEKIFSHYAYICGQCKNYYRQIDKLRTLRKNKDQLIKIVM